MPEYCTCGAELPPDARFCHKCGKPQREEPVLVEEALPPEPVVIQPVVQAPPKFNTPLALKIGLLTAAILLALTLLWAAGGLLWLILIGFLAVYFYQRRGGALTIRGGAKMGWISGLTSFVLYGLPYAIMISQPDVVATVRNELAQQGIPPEFRQQVLRILQTPIALQVVAMLVSFSVFPSLGGVIGAKVLKKS